MDMQDQKAQLNSTEDAHKDSVVTENENETLRKKRADIVIMAGLQISATLSSSFFFTSFGEIAATGAIFTPAFPICCAVFTALFFTFRYLEKNKGAKSEKFLKASIKLTNEVGFGLFFTALGFIFKGAMPPHFLLGLLVTAFVVHIGLRCVGKEGIGSLRVR